MVVVITWTNARGERHESGEGKTRTFAVTSYVGEKKRWG